MDADLPKHVNYWMTSSSKHDCFFNVGPESGPKERIGAIKILLIGHSEVLKKMLDESPLAETGDIISVTDSDPDNFKNFLKCIYGGTDIVVRKLPYEKCLSLLHLCEKYLTFEIKAKVSSSILQLHQPLSVEYVMMGLSNPACLTSTSNSLAKAISKAIQNDTEQILNHKSFLDLDSNAVTFIVKQDNISTKEVNLWKYVLNWAQNKVDSEDPKDIRSCLENILKHIRFCAMEGNDFCKLVVPTKILSQEEVFEICNAIGTTSTPTLNGLSCTILNRSISPAHEITFTYVLNNIKEFTGSTTSPQFKLGEFNWHNLIKKDDQDNLGIYLCCSISWSSCFAKFEVTLLNRSGGPDFTKKISSYHKFTNKDSNCGFSNFIPIKKLLDVEMGYIKNNAIEVVTCVELQFIPIKKLLDVEMCEYIENDATEDVEYACYVKKPKILDPKC